MSGANIFSDIIKLFFSISLSLVGWVIIVPFACLIPKRKDWIAVIGGQNGIFLDNTKYFYLQASQLAKTQRFVFITERVDIVKLLQAKDMQGYVYPSVKSIWFLLRCNYTVVDGSAWFKKGRGFLLFRSKIIQLWHGVGFKFVEASAWKNEVTSKKIFSLNIIFLIRKISYIITRRWICYSIFITTSNFYRDNVFKYAFASKKIVVIGYPRNDFSQSLTGKYKELAWEGVDNDIRDKLSIWIEENKKILLIAPTFRDSGTVPMQLCLDTIKALDKFAEINNFEFIFKFHPLEKNIDHTGSKHFHICSRHSDIYPLFPYVSALVTDYSSISMDFLLVDKPILFFIPKDDDYIEKDRQLQFDPFTMMPGAIVSDWMGLMDSLLVTLREDIYTADRAILRKKVFDDLQQSKTVSKLLNLMQDEKKIF